MHRTPDKLAENFHFDIESKDYFNGMLRRTFGGAVNFASLGYKQVARFKVNSQFITI